MSPTAQALFQSALSLPSDDRLALCEALLAIEDELPSYAPLGEDYLNELRARSTDTDPTAWTAWEEVRDRVHARFNLGMPADG